MNKDSAGGNSSDLDLTVRAGDLVGVIQQKDPLGNRDRWFCDNGQFKGFISADILTLYNDTDEGNKDDDIEEVETKPVAVVAPYDEVTEDEYKKPTRKAPPVPRMANVQATTKTRSGNNDQVSVHSYEEICAMESNMETVSCSDLSPVYEEIPGGSRSSVSSSSGGSARSGRSVRTHRSSSPRYIQYNRHLMLRSRGKNDDSFNFFLSSY